MSDDGRYTTQNCNADHCLGRPAAHLLHHEVHWTMMTEGQGLLCHVLQPPLCLQPRRNGRAVQERQKRVAAVAAEDGASAHLPHPHLAWHATAVVHAAQARAAVAHGAGGGAGTDSIIYQVCMEAPTSHTT